MSIQTDTYIKQMKEMYTKISNKKELTKCEMLFLIAYKRTIDNSIFVSPIRAEFE
jgi:hypothetical protein